MRKLTVVLNGLDQFLNNILLGPMPNDHARYAKTATLRAFPTVGQVAPWL